MHKVLMVMLVMTLIVVRTGWSEEAVGADNPAGKKPVDRAELFAKRDKDADGKLSKEEFLERVKVGNEAKAEQNFTKMDKDGDGILSKDEFVNVEMGKKRKARPE